MKFILTFITFHFILILNSCTHYMPGFDFALFDGTPNEQLARAVEKDDTTEIKRILSKGEIDINFQEPKFGVTVLMLAVGNQKINSIETLLQFGADPNLKDKSHASSVYISCFYFYDGKCQSKSLELLLKYGGNANELTIFEEPKNNVLYHNPLIESVKKGCIENIEVLLRYGADINVYTEYPGYGAITESIIHGELEVTKYLIIDKKAKIPEYCYKYERDSVIIKETVEEMLISEDYSDYPEKEKLRREILQYLKENNDGINK